MAFKGKKRFELLHLTSSTDHIFLSGDYYKGVFENQKMI